MPKIKPLYIFSQIIWLMILAGCSYAKTNSLSFNEPKASATPASTSIAPAPAVTPTSTLEPPQPRLLTICLGEEPVSLFIYGDNSSAAKSVWQAIYDGPYDIRGFEIKSVIFDQMPTLENGGAVLQAIQVKAGDLIVDSNGNITKLSEGTPYRPSGCSSLDCVKAYSGSDPIKIDQITVDFKLKTGLKWSDGAALTADDSVYSYQIARKLYPAYRSDLIRVTQSYQATDEVTVKWTGIPGYEGGEYETNFFTPLPRHAWSSIQPDQMAVNEMSGRRPIGWGAFVIDDWVAGDHISLSRNPNYFRASEGLPSFDKLVYRFVSNGQEAVNALLAGECDLIDRTVQLDPLAGNLSELQKAGKVNLVLQKETAWEQITFGISSIDPKRQNFFALKPVRQAVALCIDRSKLAQEIVGDQGQVLDSYALPDQPQYSPDVNKYQLNAQKANELLTSAGWMEGVDGLTSPRVSNGVPGIPDGTSFEFNYLVTDDPVEQKTAQFIKASLSACGLKADIKTYTWSELLSSGPDGPVFGRNFDLAQFAWTTSLTPVCNLFLSSEIPGPYPDFPKGWGGGNASGYSNPEFDAECTGSLTLPAATSASLKASHQAQLIFTDDLPILPLFSHYQIIASRPDLCGLSVDSPVTSVFWNLESLNDGKACTK